MVKYPLTVAMSVYNVARYVRAMLDCLVAQSFSNFEFLCIDDASTDGTWEILNEYAQKDKRIRLIRQEKNMGLSISRNLAIMEAQGEYLLMLDGDDMCAGDLLEKVYNKAKETDADMVVWDYCSFSHEEDIVKLQHMPSILSDFKPHDKIALLRLIPYSWIRLIRTTKFHELRIHFPEGLTKQDYPVWWQLVLSLDKIAILPERLYFYRPNPYNTTNRKDRSVFSFAFVLDITEKYLKENRLFKTYKNEYLRIRLILLEHMYDCVNPEYKAEAIKLVKERFNLEVREYLLSPKCECGKRAKAFHKGYCLNMPFEKTKYHVMTFVKKHYYRS